MPDERFAVVDGWLVELSNEHTCNGGDAQSSGHHEPNCGMYPVAKIEDLIGREAEAWEVGFFSGNSTQEDTVYMSDTWKNGNPFGRPKAS